MISHDEIPANEAIRMCHQLNELFCEHINICRVDYGAKNAPNVYTNPSYK
jgi:hypothetical protein